MTETDDETQTQPNSQGDATTDSPPIEEPEREGTSDLKSAINSGGDIESTSGADTNGGTEKQGNEAAEGDLPAWAFDEDLQDELDQRAFAGEGETIEGEIRGTGEWERDEDVILFVSKPIGSPGFRETLAVPATDEELTASKFGRLLDAKGYTLEQAKHLVGDTVECTYDGDGQWRIIDSGPPKSSPSHGPITEKSASDSSERSRKPTRSASRSSGPTRTSRLNAMRARRQMASGLTTILGAILILALFGPVLDMMIPSSAVIYSSPLWQVVNLAIPGLALLMTVAGLVKIAVAVFSAGGVR